MSIGKCHFLKAASAGPTEPDAGALDPAWSQPLRAV